MMIKCGHCGKEKPLAYGLEYPPGDLKAQYCQECYDFLYEWVTCEICGERKRRKDLGQHKSDIHSE